ncbi:hypothetical protein AAVH_25442 [Aphelenchoides avenae]|nr:hypothetical protein AAVH_25442 [Aphelenchus avenae]
MNLDIIVRDIRLIVFAMKPTIDSLSTLLFLGKYRQHLTAAGKAVGRWLVEKRLRAPARIVPVAAASSTNPLSDRLGPSQTLQQRRLPLAVDGYRRL